SILLQSTPSYEATGLPQVPHRMPKMQGEKSQGLTQASMCDEKRPCSACVRHEVLCSLSDSPPDAGTAQTVEQSFTRPSSTKARSRHAKASFLSVHTYLV
ncbi:hypothetical protein FocTR4_00011205, partial [Fusarium oxysporum f. sp. cubense]